MPARAGSSPARRRSPTGRRSPHAAASLRDSGLGVGAHLALVGHQGPVLTAREVPSLVDRRGELAPSWRPFLTRCALGRVDPDDVRREFAAQVEALRSNGLTLTHLDTHQNLHLWPSIARVDRRAGVLERRGGDAGHAVGGTIADRARRAPLLPRPRVARSQGERAVPGRHGRVRRIRPARPRPSARRDRTVRRAPCVERRAGVSSRSQLRRRARRARDGTTAARTSSTRSCRVKRA